MPQAFCLWHFLYICDIIEKRASVEVCFGAAFFESKNIRVYFLRPKMEHSGENVTFLENLGKIREKTEKERGNLRKYKKKLFTKP